MKKSVIFTLILLVTAFPSFCIKIDGKFWDWQRTGISFNCKPHVLARDRSGLDMQLVKMTLIGKHLYILIEGRSVTGLEPDKGNGLKRTSIRVSFKSAQSPLNRVRVATDPKLPYKVKVSCPRATSKYLGGPKNRYWAIGRNGNIYAMEMIVPVFYDSKGVHAGSPSGPLIILAKRSGLSREYLADMLINAVDAKTHRLVDTVELPIRKGEL